MHEEAHGADKLGVFISYSRTELDFVDQLVVTLELAGFAPAVDRTGIHGAEAWREKLRALIREADSVVFVLSPDFALSQECLWELNEAQAVGKRIIPLVCKPLGDVSPPPALAALNYIYFFPDPARTDSSWAAGMRELARVLRSDTGWLREHTRLLQRAVEWEAGGKVANRLLSGTDILEARAWIARQPRHAPPPTELHMAFIAASEIWELEQVNERERALAERERFVREAEASRADREKAQAAVLAAAERERRQAQVTTRRTLAGLMLMSALAMGTGGSAWWAWEKQREAVAARDQAERSLDRLAVAEAAEEGNYQEAKRLQAILAGKVEADEIRKSGRPGPETADEFGTVAWYSLFTREPAEALAAAERALIVAPGQLWLEGNRAIALMYLNRPDEARAIFLANKDKLTPYAKSTDKLWQVVIGEDFSALRNAGLEHPQMTEIESALGIVRK